MARTDSGPMMMDAYFTEREGVLAVAGTFNKLRCAWRETPNADVGIDGQAEYVNAANQATGSLIAVQVKSGASYLRLSGDVILFEPSAKHSRYWEHFPLPVILVIHDPAKGMSYWADARRWLRSSMTRGKPIEVPLTQTLDLAHKDALFASCGELGEEPLPIEEVVKKMVLVRNPNPTFSLSFMDIFVHGLTDICRKLFFSMGLCAEIAEWKSADGAWSIGAGDYDFIRAYVSFLVSQRLVVYDYSDFTIDWEEREMTPTLLVPLTQRGYRITELLEEWEPEASNNVVCERPVEMLTGYPSLAVRFDGVATLTARLLQRFAR